MKEIDPRLERVHQNVYLGTMLNIILGLEDLELGKITSENNWELCDELTEEGLVYISDATFIGLRCIFENSRVNLVSYQSFDEIAFSNLLVKKAGLPIIRSFSKQNEIDIRFVGTQPLIKHINSYLDPQKNQATYVKNLEINKIALIIESRDHLN